MPNSDLKGVVAAAVTPVSATYEVDAERLAKHVARLLSNGCSFVSTFGTTGEGASLSTAQKSAALDEIVALGIRPEQLVPAVMTPSLDEAAGMIAAAARHKCRGVLILPPFFYNDPSHEGVAAFIDGALQRAGRPDIDLLLYNIPRFSGVSYDIPLVSRLIETFGSAIVGIKDSTGDAVNSIGLASHFPNLSVFTGDDRVMPGLVAAGGAGIIGGVPNLFSADLRRIFDNPTDESTAGLRATQARRIEIVATRGDLLAVKAVLAVQYTDPDWARPIPPLQPLSPGETETLLLALAETGYVPITEQ